MKLRRLAVVTTSLMLGSLLWIFSGITLASPLGNVAPKIIHIGVVNERTDILDYEHYLYGEFIGYINRRLVQKGVSTSKLIVTQNILEMERAVAEMRIDVLIESVMLTLLTTHHTGLLKPSLVGWRKGQRHYHTVFFVRKDSSIKTLEGLRGHSIAFEIPRSTSAFHVPMATLRTHGIPVSAASDSGNADSVRYLFAGSELNQAYWVHRGIADAGAFNNGDWQRTPARIREDLRIIYKTKPLLRWLVSFRKGLPLETRENISTILLDMHKDSDGRGALESAMRFAKFEQLTEEDIQDLHDWRSVLLPQDESF